MNRMAVTALAHQNPIPAVDGAATSVAWAAGESTKNMLKSGILGPDKPGKRMKILAPTIMTKIGWKIKGMTTSMIHIRWSGTKEETSLTRIHSTGSASARKSIKFYD